MAWGAKKDESVAVRMAVLETENKHLTERLADAKSEIAKLEDRLRYTQEALVAKESPEAYHDRRVEEHLASLPQVPNEPNRDTKYNRAVMHLAQEMERPLFIDADDMVSRLLPAIAKPVSATPSLHGNDES